MEVTAATDSRAGVLAAAHEARHAELVATADQLQMAVEWAAMHSVDSLDEAAAADVFGETVIPIAGPGAPLVGEFCVAELAAALGLPTEVGRELIGEAVELAHRLPRVWRRVQRHELPAWRARRIARQTMLLSEVAAEFVDRQVAAVAHRIGPAATERLIEEAVARLMPETAAELRQQGADGRCFTVDHRQLSLTGTSRVYGELAPRRRPGPRRRGHRPRRAARAARLHRGLGCPPGRRGRRDRPRRPHPRPHRR